MKATAEIPPESRRNKISLLVRRNKYKTEHPYYLTELSNILNQPLKQDALLDLQETDKLLSHCLSQVQRVQNDPEAGTIRTLRYRVNGAHINICACLAEQVGSDEAVLFAGPYEYCGAVKVQIRYALWGVQSLWNSTETPSDCNH